MKWITSALYPFKQSPWQAWQGDLALMTFGCLLYAGLSGGGFLFVVGQKPAALIMASSPLLLVILATLTLGMGIVWELMASLQDKGHYTGPKSEHLVKYVLEGSQAVLFYGLILAFLVSSSWLLMPIGLVIPIALLFFYPVLLAPMLHATHDRSFLGLLDGCLDIPKMLRNNYPLLWAECTLYVLVMGGLVYPILAALLSLTGVGVLGLPGLMWLGICGFCHLMTNLHDTTLYYLASPRSFNLQPELSSLEATVAVSPAGRNVFHDHLYSNPNSPFPASKSPWNP